MTELDRLTWVRSSPGVFERELDEAELFYTTMAKLWEGTGHTYFAITACIGFKVQGPPQQFSELQTQVLNSIRYAWKRLRLDHPTLAASIQIDPLTNRCKKVYRALESEGELESWADKTLHTVEGYQTGDEFANTDPTVGDQASLYIVTPPSQDSSEVHGTVIRDLVFRCGHNIIDGIGTLKLLNNLFKYTSKYMSMHDGDLVFSRSLGDEYNNLSSPLRVTAELTKDPSEEQISIYKSTRARNDKARENAHILGVPIQLSNKYPGNSQRTAVEMSESESTKLISRCKSTGVTPTHLFHAAIALAIRDIQPRGEQEQIGKYITYALINLRGSCDKNSAEDLHPASVRQTVSVKHLIVDLTIPSISDKNLTLSKGDLLSILDNVKTFYQSNILNDDFLSTVPQLYQDVTPPYPETSPTEIPPPNPTPTVSLSSLGVVDKLIQPNPGPFSIIDPWVIGAEYSTGLGLFLGTWKGCISLGAGYNEAFHRKEDVRVLLENVLHRVRDILDVMH